MLKCHNILKMPTSLGDGVACLVLVSLSDYDTRNSALEWLYYDACLTHILWLHVFQKLSSSGLQTLVLPVLIGNSHVEMEKVLHFYLIETTKGKCHL